jgi:hypothetical protein
VYGMTAGQMRHGGLKNETDKELRGQGVLKGKVSATGVINQPSRSYQTRRLSG